MAEGVRSLTVALAIDQAMDTGRVVDLRPTWKQLSAAGIVDGLPAAARGR